MAIIGDGDLDERLAHPGQVSDIDALLSQFCWTDIKYVVSGMGAVAKTHDLPKKLRGALGQTLLLAACRGCRSDGSCQRQPQCAVCVFFGKKPQVVTPFFEGEITKPYIIITEACGDNDLSVTVRLFGFAGQWASALQLVLGDILIHRIPWRTILPPSGFFPHKIEVASQGIKSFRGIEIDDPGFPLELEFITPINTDRGNPFEKLESLCERLVRRAVLLARWHDCELAVDYEKLESEWLAADFCGDQHPLAINSPRHSMRTGRRWNTSGQLGTVRIEAEMARLWPYFKLGEKAACGRGATIGLGRYQMFF